MAVKKTAKKTVKKAAKKTFPSARKKTVPKPKWMTAKELSAVMAESQVRMDETFAKMDVRHAETEAVIAETSKKVKELIAGVDKMKERLEESIQRTERVVESTARTVRELSKNLGNVGNNIGSIVEFVVIPHIRHSINAAGGHSFTKTKADTIIRDIVDDVKKDVAQMDVFLYNDAEAMAVEVKTDLQVGDVNDHLKRLRKLRNYEDKIDIARKKLFGAVVGIVIDDRAKKYALEKGLYVVKIHEDEELLDIEKPETCRTW